MLVTSSQVGGGSLQKIPQRAPSIPGLPARVSYAPLALLNDTRRATARKHRVGQQCATRNDCARRLEVVVIEQGVERIKSLLLGWR